MLGVVLLFGGGVYAASQLQQDLLPDISIPAVIVITPDPGASPEIVDSQVTIPVVNALTGVNGVNTVQSTSSQGASLAVVLFKDGTDLKAALQDVNTAIARARPFLPPQVPASTVQTFSTNSIPILGYAVSADEPLGDLARSEEHTSELQSQSNLVCRLLLEKKKKNSIDERRGSFD